MNLLCKKIRASFYLYIAWAVSLAAFLGTFIYSEILNLPPCDLCWYQRVAMYPLTVILFVGLVLSDRRVFYYSMPFSLIGFFVATYHVLLQVGIVPEVSCSINESCATISYQLFGFMTIPMQAMLGFLIISLAMIMFFKCSENYTGRGSSISNDKEKTKKG